MEVFINASGQFLPGEPVPNEQMTDYIGTISPDADRRGKQTLRNNGIRQRHYAINADGSTDLTVAEMAARALGSVLDCAETDPRSIGFLASATTQNDFMVPGMASQVHAAMGLPPMEIANMQSVCASSMMALKAAALQVAQAEHDAALVCGAEFSSRYFRPGHYLGTDAVAADGTLPGDADFLRWTLSDGAAGLLLENRPRERGLSLKIDWITLTSFADRFAPCMTGGAAQQDDGSLKPWSHFTSAEAAARAGAFQLRQDIDALYRMLPVWLGEFMRLVDTGRIDPLSVDWFCCHYSARSLRKEMTRLATRAGCMIPEERWFTNLYEKGNVGAASIFLILDDLLRSGNLSAGQKILLAVPESGQSIMAHAGLTVMENGE